MSAPDKDQAAERDWLTLSELARRRRRHRQHLCATVRQRPPGDTLAADGAQQQQHHHHHHHDQRQHLTNASPMSDQTRAARHTASRGPPVPQPSEIDAQSARLNRLRLNDELSKSADRRAGAGHLAAAHTRTMFTGQAGDGAPPQQAQQQQQQPDERLGGAPAVVVAATTAEYQPQRQSQSQQHQASLGGQQQLPVLVPSDQYRQQQQVALGSPSPAQYLDQHHDQYQAHHQLAGQPQVVHYNHHHQAQPAHDYHQNQHHHQLLSDRPLPSLLDLDDELHNQQLDRQHQARFPQPHQQRGSVKPADGSFLPESVIRVNDWSERKLSSYHQLYGGSSGSGAELHRRAGQSAELATLNSVASTSSGHLQQLPHPNHLLLRHDDHHPHHQLPFQQQHHRRNDSASSFNLSNNSTGSVAATYSHHELEYSSTSAFASSSHNHNQHPHQHPHHHQLSERAGRELYGDASRIEVEREICEGVLDDDVDDDVDAEEEAGEELLRVRRSRHRRTNRTNRDRAARHSAATPAGSDDADELKVCEWHNCGNTFLDMREFVRHLEERHVNMEPREKNRFFCLWSNCKRNNQEFNARYKLLIHMRVHSGEKPFTCDQSAHCKKSFSRLENLKIHKRSHTGEKPYRCNYEHCSKSFTNSSDRIKHHKTHKDPKPYTCTHDGCTKRYTDPSSLRKHLRAHKRHDEPSLVVSEHNHSSAHLRLSGQGAHPLQHEPHYQQQQLMQHGRFSSSYQPRAQPSQSQQQQQQQQQLQRPHQMDNYAQQRYSYNSHSYAMGSYTGDTGKQLVYDQAQQPYLRADYDPAKEFESVLFGGSNASTVTQHEEQLLLSGSFKQPQQQPVFDAGPPREPEQGARYLTSAPHLQVQCQQHQHRFSTTAVAARTRESYSEAQARQHQRLSRSWCAGNSVQAVRSSARARDAPHHQTGGSHYQPPGPPQGWSQAPNPPHQGDQRQPIQENQVRQDNLVYSSYANQAYQGEPQQPPAIVMDQQDTWSSGYASEPVQRTSLVQFQQIGRQAHSQQHPQERQNQQQRQQHQPLQRQLTRQQQHEQLMRSMPANVNL